MHAHYINHVRRLGNAPKPEVAPIHPSFRIVQELAADLSKGEVFFPTFIDATLKIRRVLSDPQVNADRVARTICAEPLLAAKLVHLANSAALGASGKPVGDVKGAVLRVGYSNVHTIAATVAMAQLVVAKEMRPYLKRAEAVWAHSVDVAAIAFVLARKMTSLNPDEALFAGLLHDVGRFYLLSKLPNYPELTEDPVALEAVLDEWHASIGHAVLGTIGLPDAALDAVAEHESAKYCATPTSLTDVIAVANRLSKSPHPPQRPDSGVPPQERVENPDMRPLLELLEASSDELMSLVVALRA